jgi:hypothetical protein
LPPLPTSTSAPSLLPPPQQSSDIASECLLTPLCEPFTEEQLDEFLKQLLSQCAPKEEGVDEAVRLPDYLAINARASDSGII